MSIWTNPFHPLYKGNKNNLTPNSGGGGGGNGGGGGDAFVQITLAVLAYTAFAFVHETIFGPTRADPELVKKLTADCNHISQTDNVENDFSTIAIAFNQYGTSYTCQHPKPRTAKRNALLLCRASYSRAKCRVRFSFSDDIPLCVNFGSSADLTNFGLSNRQSFIAVPITDDTYRHPAFTECLARPGDNECSPKRFSSICNYE